MHTTRTRRVTLIALALLLTALPVITTQTAEAAPISTAAYRKMVFNQDITAARTKVENFIAAHPTAQSITGISFTVTKSVYHGQITLFKSSSSAYRLRALNITDRQGKLIMVVHGHTLTRNFTIPAPAPVDGGGGIGH